MQNLIPKSPKPAWHSVTAYNSQTSDKSSEPPQQQWEIYYWGNLTVAPQTEGLHIPDFTVTHNLKLQQ